MSILDVIFGIFAPHCCLGCNREGALLCRDCAVRIQAPKTTLATELLSVTAAAQYSGVAKELVQRLKFSGMRSAATVMVGLLPQQDYSAGTIVVHAPTSPDRVRRRGYDQAVVLAKVFAKRYGLQYAPCLVRYGTQHQIGKTRAERLQLTNAFAVTRPHRINDKHVILIDDVCTTGATLFAAAEALRAAGVKSVEGVVFAQA